MKFFIGMAILAAGASTAIAEPFPSPWTGCHVGIIGSLLHRDDNIRTALSGSYLEPFNLFGSPPSRGTLDRGFSAGASGLGAGGSFGCSQAFGNHVVLGLEGDLSWMGTRSEPGARFPISSVASSFGDASSSTQAVSSQLERLGTIRIRVGYEFGNWLPYVTAGLASGRQSSSATVLYAHDAYFMNGNHFVGASAKSLSGWTIGGGLEGLVRSGWSIRAEYLYVDLGDLSYELPCVSASCSSGGFATKASLDSNYHIARAGVFYRY